ncbi:hypothetical protein MN086_03370 [Sulfurovum sp. XGS-02]|uniref:hypothetical protein n=1 Tax=Sulfurovum sp. XGS-02 TaxID=2925411 RepID=UPI00206EACF7|nr:hypothetical protein [Sulfurovum sp. XGS-02]UPT78192.1 hypothetical protein MN086_03370 [Sulfurovum sp. XGS-02]
MSPTNKELQLRKNCKLYVYLLVSQGKEVPEEVQECANSYDFDFLVDCVAQLSAEIEGLDSDAFEKIVNNKESDEARELAYWWEMHQMANSLGEKIVKTCL